VGRVVPESEASARGMVCACLRIGIGVKRQANERTIPVLARQGPWGCAEMVSKH
jgi:hypothetical protein